MNKLIDRSQEKLELAKGLGLNGYQSFKETEAKNKADAIEKAQTIKELTSMSFKPIGKDTFKFFPKWKWVGFKKAMNDGGWPLRKVTVGNMRLAEWKDELPYGALLAVVEAKKAGVFGHKPEASWSSIMNRMLANMYSPMIGIPVIVDKNKEEVKKEVVENLDYKIYFPQIEQRIKADPIITGIYKGVEVEIFAWDDSKVYE